MTGDLRAIAAAGVTAVVIAVIGVGVVVNDSPARSAAANAVRPTAPQPGLPVPQRHVEESPPIAATVPGDGTWIIGKEIKRGTYRTTGSSICLWQRLGAQVAGHWVVVDGAFKAGAQTVALGKDDVAFDTQGCPVWELVR